MMKVLLYLAVLLVLPLQADQKTEIFQVSKSGGEREKLMQISAVFYPC